MIDRSSIAEIHAQLRAASGRRLASLMREHADDPRSGVQAALASARRRHDAEAAERARLRALYALEDELRAEGHATIVGLDEVGRGALAGPLTVAAVVLPPDPHIERLDDSKRLAPPRREEVATRVHEVALAVAVAHVDNTVVDRLGMTQALRTAFGQALAQLGLRPDVVLLDGLPMRLHPAERSVVKGDSTVAAIAAASCVAKVARDALMRSYAADHPAYGFDVHKGYSAPEHLEALKAYGPCPLHRMSFAPCAEDLRLF